jgi:hypothetical protein
MVYNTLHRKGSNIQARRKLFNLPSGRLLKLKILFTGNAKHEK